MATPQNSKPEPSKIIRPISKFAGALVGTAVVTGKRIIGSVKPTSEGPSDKHREKTLQASAKKPSVKHREKTHQAPAKRKKDATPKKKDDTPRKKEDCKQ
jgi:hypothetical protein